MSTDKNAPFTRATMGIVDGLPLTASSGGIEDLRRDVQMLMDMEAIRQLKHRYFRCIDTANVAELAEIFHDDVEVHFVGGTYEWKLNGKAQYLGSIGGAFHNQSIGHHNAHHPEIQMLSATEATAIWYLNDQELRSTNPNIETSIRRDYTETYMTGLIDYIVSLKVHNCTQRDAGKYTAYIRNEHGSTSSSAFLVVGGEDLPCYLPCYLTLL